MIEKSINSTHCNGSVIFDGCAFVTDSGRPMCTTMRVRLFPPKITHQVNPLDNGVIQVFPIG